MDQKLNADPTAWIPPLKKGGGRPRKDGTPTARQLTRGWRISYIKKILVNRAVLGEYQPYVETPKGRVPVGAPIPNYFPALVEPEVFEAVQALMTANQGKGGRTGKVRNLLAHLAKCAYCGGPMAFSDRGAKGDRWLLCDNGRRGVRDEQTGEPLCRRYSMKYAECEQLILDGCLDLKPEQVLPDPDEHAQRVTSLRHRLQGKEAELAALERQKDNLIDQIARTDDPAIRDRYESKVKELNERAKTLTAERGTVEAELAKAESSVQSFAAWQRNFKALKQALKTGDVELREKLRAHLQELVDRIEVYAVGGGGQGYASWYKPFGPVDPTAEGEARYYCAFTQDDADLLSLPPSEAERFIAYVNGRLATKEGRFLRVYFKSLPPCVPLDFAPEGSLARGALLTRPELDIVDAWDVVEPSFKQLRRDFEAAQKTRGSKRTKVK
jgi:hypothetical protein